MGRTSIQRRSGYRDAEIERLERERDRLQKSLYDTKERFRQFMRESREFASQMRGRLGERRRLDLHHSVLSELEKTNDPGEIAGKILEILGHGLGMSLGVSWRVDGETLRCDGIWRPPGLGNGALEEMERACRDSVFRWGEALPGSAWKKGGTVWAGDLVRTDGTDPRSAIAASEGLHRAISFPIGNSGGTLLVIEMFGGEIEAPDEDLIRTLTILGYQVAQVIERRRAEEALAEDLEDTRLLHDLSTRYVSESGIQGLYDEIMDAAITLTQADAGTVQMFDDETQELVLLATQGFGRNMVERFHRVNAGSNTSCGIAMANNERSFVDFDVPAGEDPDGSMRMHVDAGYLSAQSTPLITRSGKTIGMVSTHWRQHHRPTERKLRFLDLLARQAADLIEHRQAEEALRESEARYRAFITASSDVLYRMSADWSEMRSLPGMGFMADTEKPNREWLEQYIPRDEQPRLMAAIREAIRTRSIFELEHRVYKADGTIGWTFSRAIPMLNAENEVTEWFGAAGDITGRKRREQDQAVLVEITDDLAGLENIEETMQRLGEKIGRYFGVTQCVFGEWTEDLETAMSAYGWSLDGTPSLRGTYRTRGLLSDEQIRACLAGEPSVVNDTQKDPSVNAESCTALGIRSFVIVPLVRDHVQRFYLAMGVDQPREWRDDEIGLMREITERIWTRLERARAEEALRESEERFRQFAENSEDVLWILNADTRQLEYLSPAYERIWGEPRGAVLEDLELWKELVHPEDRERVSEGMARLLGGETFSQEYRIVRPGDGEVRWILDTGFPITYEAGRIKRAAGIAQDVTMRRRAEEERGRLRALEAGGRAQRTERRRISRELHDRVAHDMAVAHQALQLHEALKEDNPEWAARKLAAARQTVRTALDATRNLSSELQRPAAEESLKDALREFVDGYVPEEMEMVFSFDGDESSVPDSIRGQTYLILREAVRNALKHSGCHSLKVGVEILPEEVRASVGDDGCGFEPDGDHDGVGLKSMRERTALLGGGLNVVSGNGAGTTVEINVPLAHPGEEG